MALDRTTLLQEPGLLVIDSQHIYSQGEIKIDLVADRQDVESDAFGVLDTRQVDRRLELTMTPVGELEALATLYSHGGLLLGQSPFGAVDTTATIFTESGKSFVLHNAAVTKMPDLVLSHKATLFGELGITGLLRNSTNPHAANAYYTYTGSGASYPGDANFDPASIKTLGYVGGWGSAPWNEFYTEEGFKVAFNSSFENVQVDGHGTVDMRLSGLSVTVTATPVGLTPSAVLDALQYQGVGNELGASSVAGADLEIVNQVGASQMYFSLSNPTLTQAPVRFGAKVRGIGELQWQAARTMTAGSPNPLFYVGASALGGDE